MENLFDIISSVSENTNATITYTSDCKFPKKSGLGNVTKKVTLDCILNLSYEKAVNERLAEQGKASNFVAEPLKWGVWEIENKVISHKGQRYLRYYGTNGNHSETYYVNGQVATPQQIADIKAYLASKDKTSATQSASGLTSNQVITRCVAFDNILDLKIQTKKVA